MLDIHIGEAEQAVKHRQNDRTRLLHWMEQHPERFCEDNRVDEKSLSVVAEQPCNRRGLARIVVWPDRLVDQPS